MSIFIDSALSIKNSKYSKKIVNISAGTWEHQLEIIILLYKITIKWFFRQIFLKFVEKVTDSRKNTINSEYSMGVILRWIFSGRR